MCCYGNTHPPGGYDSDVDREKRMDYSTKTYAQTSRDPSLLKPHQQQTAKQEVGMASGNRGVVSRSVTAVRKVVTNDAAPTVKVSAIVVVPYSKIFSWPKNFADRLSFVFRG